MLGHDLEMTCTEVHGNRLIIDGEMDEHVQIYQNIFVLDYSWLFPLNFNTYFMGLRPLQIF